jgi:DNA adenine methylase
MLASRTEYNRIKSIPSDTMTDVQRAARFLYLQSLCFGGKTNGVFAVSKERPARFDHIKMFNRIEQMAERLSSVTIENLPYHDFIERYDTPDTLFYLDPPYWDCEDYYGKGIFGKSDFEKLADLLGKIKGKFLLSINDTPQIREIFKTFNIEQVSLKYTCGNTKAARNKDRHELIISNK